MKYEAGYNRLLVGDLYHWESDHEGRVVIKENFIQTEGVKNEV